jgi:AcrR family transcriptional regulator
MPVTTKERILDVAWRLFVRQGFAGTTVTQIEAAASLAPGSGSFYRHFRSKEDVLRAVVDHQAERVDAARDLGPEPEEIDGDVRIALSLELQRRLENLRKLRPLIVLVQREREHLGPSRDHLGTLLVDRNVTVRSKRLEAWMAAGAIPKRDPQALATVIMCALTGYHDAVQFFGGPPAHINEDRFVTSLVDLITGA